MGAVLAAHWTDMDGPSYLQNYHHLRGSARWSGNEPGPFFELFAAADAQWYASIAERGYTARSEFTTAGCVERPKLTYRCENYLSWAFFPLWPLVIRLLLPIVVDPFAAGFVAANLFSLAAAVVLFLYLRTHYEEGIAIISVLLVYVSPFALFLDAPFTESLFLLLVSCVFLATDKCAWAITGICLGLLSVTRPNGIFVAIVPIVALANQV